MAYLIAIEAVAYLEKKPRSRLDEGQGQIRLSLRRFSFCLYGKGYIYTCVHVTGRLHVRLDVEQCSNLIIRQNGKNKNRLHFILSKTKNFFIKLNHKKP